VSKDSINRCIHTKRLTFICIIFGVYEYIYIGISYKYVHDTYKFLKAFPSATGGTYVLFFKSVWWSSDLFPCLTSQFFKRLALSVVNPAPPCLPQKDRESHMQQSAYNIRNHAVSIIFRQQSLTLGSSPYFMLSDQSLVKSIQL